MSLLLRAIAALLAMFLSATANAAWHEAKSRHFIIYADLKPNQIRDYAERLERFDQAVRLVRDMADPELTDAQRLTVYALRSEAAVERLAGSSNVRGFYNASAAGAAIFVPRKAGSAEVDWDLDTQAIFFHEYAHHMQLESASHAIPPWLVEGFAEFFATAKVEKDGSVAIGLPPQYRAYGLFTTGGLRLEEMVGATYAKLSNIEVDQLYGMGWLLTHYLAFEPKRRGQLTRYMDGLRSGQSAPDAAKAAFGDLKALDRELEKYKRGRISGFRISADKLSIGDIAVRPLGAGEAAIMDVHIRSQRGVDKTMARKVAVDARKAAAAFPNEPFVQAALAEAEYDDGNYSAAEAAADRALAANPNHVQALIYKGRARMELAKGKPDSNWTDVRSWFSRANRLDTENAEPLALFFESYGHSGAKPTKNATDGLLYAVELVPQDSGVRLNAVRQMLIEGRLEEAKNLFAPLAYRPHAPERFRESNAQVMAAIAAGDGKLALAVLEAAMAQPVDKEASR